MATITGSAPAPAWYSDRRARGFRTLVEELFTHPDSVVLGLRATRPEPPETADAVRPDLLHRLFRLSGAGTAGSSGSATSPTGPPT
ncbi:hypothetical protein ABH940_001601 [Streptacidiphilus sp. BW17]|uniref:hypothetical protein n=1 Tax=Streptacidiphilus sp. BW17 TaxID=3156274 RepID=UPI003514FEAF